MIIFFPHTRISSAFSCPLSVARLTGQSGQYWSACVHSHARHSRPQLLKKSTAGRTGEHGMKEREEGGKRERQDEQGAWSRGRWALIESFGPCFVRSQGLLQESGFMLFLTMGFGRKGICSPVGFLRCDSLPYTPLMFVIPVF